MALEQDPNQQPDDFDIRILPEMAGGVWANFARVSHSPYEFTLDFVRLDFTTADPIQGVLVQRVNMSPQFVEQLIKVLEANLTLWASIVVPTEMRWLEEEQDDE